MAQSATQNYRLGVDIGGTFTDVVLEAPTGTTGGATPMGRVSAKVLTTHAAPEDAIIEGIRRVTQKAGIAPAEIGQIIHGTTLATNALIERRGARTAFITTAGFRDVIEMRTESRFEQYDLNLILPEPLIPRNRRYVIVERIDARGDVLIELKRKDIETLAEILRGGHYESIAIGLLHAYANDRHERMIADVLAEKLPHVMVSLSSEVSPQMREYERFNTTIANAYIKPLMKSYLLRLRGRLADEGVDCPIFLIHSGGGIMALEVAAEFPVRLVESGPAGGAIFAADIAARYGLKKALSFDMGGTTAKICLIRNKMPKTARVFEVARSYRFKKGSGMPVSIPVIDMVEIGAGGGSLARVDNMKQIRVGPESAGSEPGPACYGRGGVTPAVTDADLVLGRLDGENFAGGSIALNKSRAEDALTEAIATPLAIDITEAAWGLSEVVDENMANAARVHAVENGEDLSQYTMIAFGGAAPLHAGRLCEKLGIDKCLIPEGAGVGSAIGFLCAPFSFEASRSHFMTLDDFDPGRIKTLFDEMEKEACGFVRSCDAEAEISSDYKAYMRYAGQGWEIPIALMQDDITAPDLNRFRNHFEEAYHTLFGRRVDGLAIEITVWSVNAFTSPHTPAPMVADDTEGHDTMRPEISSTRTLFDPSLGTALTAPEIKRDAMTPGMHVAGPAVITETETTAIVPSGFDAIGRGDGCLDLSRRHSRSDVLPRTPSMAEGATKPQDQRCVQSGDVAYQVMWNRLISVVEEQAQALVRTAFSTSVREAGDLSAGVYNDTGAMLAQAVTGTPGHVNAMADAVGHFIRRIGRQNILDGDIYITNDPWEGTGHKHDITVVTPSFYHGILIGFFACTAHVTDIGGRGFGADANDVHEEGLYIPIMKYAERGVVDKTLIKLIRGNVREPDQLIGDITALATCNSVGHRRLIDMAVEFGLDDLTGISDFILTRSHEATLAQIGALPCGSAEGHMRIDGYDTPIDLRVKITIEKDRIISDWHGTSGVDRKGINVPLVYTKAYACYALKCAIAPDIPNNAASLAPFEIAAPENSIVNAVFPAPVALRHVIGHMIPDTVYDALDKLLPGLVPAEGAGCLCNFQVSLRPVHDPQGTSPQSPLKDTPPKNTYRTEVLTFNSGGSGARPRLDGMNATAFPSGVMTMPVEATENVGPVVIWRKELRPSSGGAGQYRGGLGQYMDVGALEGYAFDFSAMFDRMHYPPRGRGGGGPGGATEITRSDGAALRGKGKQFIPHGLVVRMAFPGGGGYGDAAMRPRDAVVRDLALGYITPTDARDIYGLTEEAIADILAHAERGDIFTF